MKHEGFYSAKSKIFFRMVQKLIHSVGFFLLEIYDSKNSSFILFFLFCFPFFQFCPQVLSLPLFPLKDPTSPFSSLITDDITVDHHQFLVIAILSSSTTITVCCCSEKGHVVWVYENGLHAWIFRMQRR